MPPSRSSRARKDDEQAPNYAETDSGDDTERDEPTPKTHRTASKKRVSDVYDASFTSESGRAPLRSVNLNDDAAEKRRRRQSAKVAMMPLDDNEAGPSGEGSADAERDPTRPTVHGKQKQLPPVDEAPKIQLSMDVMNSNFEEWMKMATDNKINANNSWNVALIDYFHDMSLLRNNTDNSINFQRASFTLDGCVKIWTSRVDSVGTETGKLLSNLANEGRVGDDEDGDEEGGEEGGSQPNKKRKTHRPASTLAKDAAQLRSKKLDLGFRVDPLFRKTCADFDEGGAQGLLMNHLSLGVVSDGSLRVVFDASDSVGRDGDEELMEEPPDEVNLAELRKTFLPNLDELEDKAICRSLEGFSFSKDAFAFEDLTMFRDDPIDDDDDDGNEPASFNNPDDVIPPMDLDGAGADYAVEDFFVGDQAIQDDYVHDNPASPSVGSEQAEGHQGGAGGYAPTPFDHHGAPNENNLFMAPTDGDGGLMFDYFDHKTKNWAGPEHWKLRKVVRRPAETADAPAKRREKKEAFKIDFLTPSDKSIKDIAKELFAPVTKGAGITLPGAPSRKGAKGRKGKEKEDRRFDNTLPDDMHFSSRQLVTLFLKPKFSLKMRGQRSQLEDRADGEIDENFWAQAAADQAAGRAEEDIDQTQNGGGIPFNTQFFQDDDDDGHGFDDIDDGGDGPLDADMEQELLSSVEGPIRRARPEFVNYAKRAKRVDVRKLKDNIWKNLDIVVPDSREDGVDAMDLDDKQATDPSEPRVFENVISGLKRSYPREKMEEISTSFCFICLLHLANERGLKLETTIDDMPVDETDEGEKRIGNLWNLQVYRDPDATPSA
ncbi:condensin complex subunit 2/barren [Cytidiella melzeri]|nr:condensin complex subunit 2/barren [Cytidiella melzeri]